MSPSATLIRLYEFLKNNSHLSMTNQNTPIAPRLSPAIRILWFAPNSSTNLRSGLDLHSLWWRMTGSNRRPPACKAGALPAELIPHGSFASVVGLVGFEPTTPALSRRCSNRLSYRPSSASCSSQTLICKLLDSHELLFCRCCVSQPISVGARI